MTRPDRDVHAPTCDRLQRGAISCPCGFTQRWLAERAWLKRAPVGCRGEVGGSYLVVVGTPRGEER